MRRPWWGVALAGLAQLLAALAAVQSASALDPKRSIPDMFHRTYGPEDGLPSGLTTIAQTPDGYLWVGSTSGLYRFDGARFESIAADQLLGPSIIGLAATRAGDLWIGYDMGGGVSRLRNGKMEHFKSDEGGPSGSINNIRVSEDGTEVFTHGAYTVHRFHDGKWTNIFQTEGISQIEMARGDVLWAKNSEQLFYCRPKGGDCHAAPGYAGGVTGLTRDSEGRVWTSDSEAGGRMYRTPDLIGIRDTAIPGPEYGATMPPRVGNRIYIDRDGSMWGWNGGEGILRIPSIFADAGASDYVETFTEADGLTSNVVSRFFEDREGSIWVSTRAGLDQFRPANVVIERSIPTNVGVAAYHASPIGDYLYVQANTTPSNTGPLFRLPTNGPAEKILDDIRAVRSMAQTADGTIWLNGGGYPFRLSGKELELLEAPPPEMLKNPRTHASSLKAGPGNTLLVWLWYNGAWENTNGVWRQHPTMPTPEQLERVELVQPGRDGAFWMSHYDPYKLYRHQDGLFKSFTDADVKIGSISNITVLGPLEYLAGEHGIAIFDGERFHTLASDRVPQLESVRGVMATETDIWAVSRVGIMRFDRAAAELAMRDPKALAPPFETFNQLDGLPSAFTMSSQSIADDVMFPRPDGRIVFLTGAGVAWIDPTKIVRNPLAPPVVIRRLIANGQGYDSPSEVALPAGSENLEIDYAALSFVEQSRVRFRYKLEGVDKDWIDPGVRRSAFYTRLEPGNYTFRVIAANDAGVWNEEGAMLSFSIEPTFLQSIWFKLIVAALLLALAVAAYMWRVRWETARIRRQFEVRTAERERIARELHDTLLQGVQGLILRVQSVTNTLPAGGEVRGALEQTLDRADEVLREGRERVRDLRLPRMEDDLPHMLAQIAKAQIAGDKPEFKLTVEGVPRPLLPPAQEEVLRIAEEAIRNVVQHAQATTIEAVLTFGRGSLGLLIRDDGVGIDADVAKTGKRVGHFGLVGMNERAARIGGKLTVSSREKSGADILLVVPAKKVYPEGAAKGAKQRKGR